ncbi:MAG: lysophospholipase [Candidatus Omnitrophica bacterium]|nr:lysophospholipase [Candidatus Omnitrophota bacterium]
MPRLNAPDAAARRPDEHYLLSFDGTPLHYWFWPFCPAHADPPPTVPHSPNTVLIIHGAGEYAERYRHFAAFLNSRGYHAAALDLRGFGQSGGARAHVNHFSDYASDINIVAAHIAQLAGPKSLHLLGHSMGALACASAAADLHPTWLASLTLTSPCVALSFPVPPHLRAIGAVCSRLRPRQLFATKAISELLTHDPDLARQHRADPRIVHFMSARLFFQMNQAMNGYLGMARRIDVPTAIFQAGDDRVVSASASRSFFEAIPHKAKSFKLYPGLFHEILNESSRLAVYEDVVSYLDSYLSVSDL